jgi:GT2 family glycosyltransferase
MTGAAPTPPPRRSVTVVVPVYGDWDSLRQCIQSLQQHVDARHSVLFVNDCGPEAEAMEQHVLRATRPSPNFAYHRNARNLGFVKTCNRAVFELDQTNNDILLLNSDTVVTGGFLEEMLEVLYLSDRHGVVTPRSNNATLATVPLHPLEATTREDPAYSKRVYDAVTMHLPRYAVVPVGVGFCLLVRRRLIRDFGLFDEAFGLGYNEENEFCLRINTYGYSSVISNHAFVYHLESRSFSREQREALNRRNESILLRRHRYYPRMVQRYLDQDVDPVDHFADVIARVSGPVKVLINLFDFPLIKAGTMKAGLSALQYARDLAGATPNVEIVVLCQVEAVRYHGLKRFGFRLVHPQTIGDELFHISYAPLQFFRPENLILANRHALRNTLALLDVISLRCQYLLAEDPKRRAVFLDALRLADTVITISEFTRRDTLAYFHPAAHRFADKMISIRLGVPPSSFDERDPARHRGGIRRPRLTDAETFILVFGNEYRHKALDRVLPYLERQDVVSVVLGSPRRRSTRDHVVVAPSGHIADEEVEALLAHCSLVLFPSQYEGFGLPILEAVHHGKPVLYYASEVGDEVARLASAHVGVESFETFDQLPDKIRRILSRRPPAREAARPPIRSLTDFNREVFDRVLDLARQPYTDFQGLRDRWYYFANVRDYYRGRLGDGLGQKVRQRMIAKLKEYPGMYRTTRQIYRRVWPQQT